MKFNVAQFKKETATKRRSATLVTKARALAQAGFLDAKQELLESFDEHPVTQELEQGPEGENISHTLNGKGNLFSFIGFYDGDEPTETVREALEKFTILLKTPETIETGNKIIFRFGVRFPSMTELEALTPMPWESGRSWLRGIERGISGFGHYIYWIISERSRSGTALQTATTLRDGKYTPTSYLSRILKEFKTKFK
jgi:hypothetical protein